MGYDLSLCAASDAQIDCLTRHSQFTRDFVKGQRPRTTVTETVGSWFSRREVEKQVDVSLECAWPECAPTEVILYSKGGIYFLLNGTHDKVDGVTNFPHVGGRFRGEMLGSAVELGEVFLGQAHAFRAAQARELFGAVSSLDAATLEMRGQAHAREVEEDQERFVEEALDDIERLGLFLGKACGDGNGVVWYWG